MQHNKKRSKGELIYNKKYLKAEKNLITKNQHKKGFQRFCVRLIFIDSIYREYENYYLQVFL